MNQCVNRCLFSSKKKGIEPGELKREEENTNDLQIMLTTYEIIKKRNFKKLVFFLLTFRFVIPFLLSIPK